MPQPISSRTKSSDPDTLLVMLHVAAAWDRKATEAFYTMEGWWNVLRPTATGEDQLANMHRFYGNTSMLVQWITEHHPHLDPTPLSATYDTVAAWNLGGCELPPPIKVKRTLDQAMIVVSAMMSAQRARIEAASSPHPQLSDLQQCILEAIRTSREPLKTAEDLAKAAGYSCNSSFRQTIADLVRFKVITKRDCYYFVVWDDGLSGQMSG